MWPAACRASFEVLPKNQDDFFPLNLKKTKKDFSWTFFRNLYYSFNKLTSLPSLILGELFCRSPGGPHKAFQCFQSLFNWPCTLFYPGMRWASYVTFTYREIPHWWCLLSLILLILSGVTGKRDGMFSSVEVCHKIIIFTDTLEVYATSLWLTRAAPLCSCLSVAFSLNIGSLMKCDQSDKVVKRTWREMNVVVTNVLKNNYDTYSNLSLTLMKQINRRSDT